MEPNYLDLIKKTLDELHEFDKRLEDPAYRGALQQRADSSGISTRTRMGALGFYEY